MKLQSIIFKKSIWTKKQIERWLGARGLLGPRFDLTENEKIYRFDLLQISPPRLRLQNKGNGISFMYLTGPKK